MNFSVFDQFKLIRNGALSNDDVLVLSLLYQPLIGMDGHSLYMTLYALANNQNKKSDTYDIKKLLDLLNVKVELLENAINKIQAIGLIEVYKHKEKGYMFKLRSPMSAHAFIMDGSLGVYLYSQIGEAQFRDLLEGFQLERIPKTYENVTKRFDDVFTSSSEEHLDLFGEYINKEKPHSIEVVNESFDFDLFINLLSQNFVDVLDKSDKLKDSITKLAYTYNLSEFEMKEVYIRSTDDDFVLIFDKLPKEARNEYRFKTSKNAPRIKTIKEDNLSNGLDKESLEYYLTKNTPEQILFNLSGIKPSGAELKVVEELLLHTNFTPGVINVMILYVLRTNKNKMPTYPYFEKVANEWARVGIKTVNGALDYIKARDKKVTKAKPKKYGKQSSITPDWYEEYDQSFKKRNQDKKTEDIDLDKLKDSLEDM